MTPLERAARAMMRHQDIDPDVYKGMHGGYGYWLDAAHEVITAIRDVDGGSPAVLAAGKQSLYSCSADPELEDARGCFHAMIDAMLEELPQQETAKEAISEIDPNELDVTTVTDNHRVYYNALTDTRRSAG